MSERVSRATAEKLRQAGWQHTLEPGDWVRFGELDELVVWLSPKRIWFANGDEGPTYINQTDELLHLPSAEQLLEVLAEDGIGQLDVFPIHWSNTGETTWTVYLAMSEGRIDIGRERKSLAEAAASVWLDVHPVVAAQP